MPSPSTPSPSTESSPPAARAMPGAWLIERLAQEFAVSTDRVARTLLETYDDLLQVAADSPHFGALLLSRVRQRLFQYELLGW
jgi:hypothetical protein